jgi:hypothetical protein
MVVLNGCGKSGPSVNYVEGVVTLDGKPIEGVTVGFSPVDATKGLAAVGTTDANGVFKLTATQGGSTDGGTVAGEYQVALTKIGTDIVTEEEAKKMQEDPNYGKEQTGPPVAPVVKSAIPEAYGNPATSGIKVTVKDGENKGDAFKFDLKSSFTGG